MQNVYNDLYTEKTDILSDSEKAKMMGYPGDAPDVKVIYPTYPGENGRPGNAKVMGFTPLFFQPDTIAADGSTVFEVYYDRNYYLMNFNMDGGFGTAPVYARYGTAFTVAQPTKPGYVFAGWELEKVNGANASAEQKVKPFPTTIPAENRTYKAIWTTVDASYTVAYWILNDKNTASEADDVKTYLGSQRKKAQSGSSVSGSDDLRQADGKSVLICGEEESDKHIHSDETCRVSATDLRYMDFVKADQNVIVEGDGSTVVNAYYEYREYTLKFYYAMSSASGTGTGTSYYVVGGSTYGFGADASSYVDRNSEVALLSQYLGNGGWHTRTGSAAEMPVLNTKGQARGYTMGSDDATVGNTEYQYHYISFKARYGDDISNLWPCDVFCYHEQRQYILDWQ